MNMKIKNKSDRIKTGVGISNHLRRFENDQRTPELNLLCGNLERLFDCQKFTEEEEKEINRIVLETIKEENARCPKLCKTLGCADVVWDKSFLYCKQCEVKRRVKFKVDESIHGDHILIMP